MTNRQGNAIEKIIQYFVLGVVIIVLSILTFSINRSDTYSIEQRRIDDEQTKLINGNNLESSKCITEIKTTLRETKTDVKEIRDGVDRLEMKLDFIANQQMTKQNKTYEDFLAGGR